MSSNGLERVFECLDCHKKYYFEMFAVGHVATTYHSVKNTRTDEVYELPIDAGREQ